MHAGGAGFDHRLHQFKRIQHAAEAGLGIGDDRLQEVDAVVALGVVQLVGAQQRVVDALDHLRHRVGGIQRLVRIHLTGDVGVGRDLPAAEIDRLQPGLDLLHRLVAGERAERVDEVRRVQRLPQFLGAEFRQRMLDGDSAAQAHHVLCRIRTGDAGPACVVAPVQAELFGGGQVGLHVGGLWVVDANVVGNRRWLRQEGINRSADTRAGSGNRRACGRGSADRAARSHRRCGLRPASACVR